MRTILGWASLEPLYHTITIGEEEQSDGLLLVTESCLRPTDSSNRKNQVVIKLWQEIYPIPPISWPLGGQGLLYE